jgi:hypothetical protein
LIIFTNALVLKTELNYIKFIIYIFLLVKCALNPQIPTDCLTGFSYCNSPTEYVSYKCNEDLPGIIKNDNKAVEEALTAARQRS